MADFPTRAELFQIGADEVLLRSQARPEGTRISPEAVYTEGTDINIIVQTNAQLGEEISSQMAYRFNALYLNGAERQDLDRLVTDRTSNECIRKAASRSYAVLTFYRTGGALPAINLPQGFLVTSVDGQEFSLQTGFSFGAGQTGPITAVAVAVNAGLSGNVAAGTITGFATNPPDASLSVINVVPATGGSEVESDDSYRARAKEFYRTQRRGTPEAIIFGAKTVPGVETASVFEETDTSGIETGRVYLYIADVNGQANQALIDQVRIALFEYRAAGVYVDINGSSPTYVPIKYRLRFRPNVNSTQAFAQIQSATVSQVNALAPGQPLQISMLFTIARSVPGVIVYDDAIQSPIGDIIPASNEILRTTASLVTVE